MNSSHDNLEMLLTAYMDALDAGELHRVGALLELAETIPGASEALLEINEAYYAEIEAMPIPHITPGTDEIQTVLQALSSDGMVNRSIEEPTPDTQTTEQTPSRYAPRMALSGVLLLGVCAMAWLGLWPAYRQAAQIKQAIATCVAKPTNATQHKSWVKIVHQTPQKMLAMLTSGELHQDLIALRKNQHLSAAVARKVSRDSLQPAHRAVRARLHLRLARFHIKNYNLALRFHHEVFQRRMASQSTPKSGIFHYYQGRLRCLQGNAHAGQQSLLRAKQHAPTSHQDRIELWQQSCRREIAKPEQRRALQAFLRNYQPKHKQHKSWADWYLLHIIHGLTPHAFPKGNARASLYAAVLQRRGAAWPRNILRTPIEREQYRDQRGMQGQFEYYDPAVFAVMAKDFAHRALRLLKQASPRDRYAPFYRAESLRLLGRRKAAFHALIAFLQQPPAKIRGEYLFFSHRLSPVLLQREACFHLSQSPTLQNKQANRLLRGMAQTDEAGQALAGLGLIQRKLSPALGYRWIQAGMERAEEAAMQARKHYWIASVQEPNPQRRRGAQIIAQLGLYRYQFRALFLWGGMGAMRMNQGNQATQWLEMLHRKHTPYKIAGENEPLQFAWTARAYVGAGNPGVAALFLAKNTDAFPSLTQLVNMLRVWRIYEGMERLPGIKG